MLLLHTLSLHHLESWWQGKDKHGKGDITSLFLMTPSLLAIMIKQHIAARWENYKADLKS